MYSKRINSGFCIMLKHPAYISRVTVARARGRRIGGEISRESRVSSEDNFFRLPITPRRETENAEFGKRRALDRRRSCLRFCARLKQASLARRDSPLHRHSFQIFPITIVGVSIDVNPGPFGSTSRFLTPIDRESRVRRL